MKRDKIASPPSQNDPNFSLCRNENKEKVSRLHPVWSILIEKSSQNFLGKTRREFEAGANIYTSKEHFYAESTMKTLLFFWGKNCWARGGLRNPRNFRSPRNFNFLEYLMSINWFKSSYWSNKNVFIFTRILQLLQEFCWLEIPLKILSFFTTRNCSEIVVESATCGTTRIRFLATENHWWLNYWDIYFLYRAKKKNRNIIIKRGMKEGKCFPLLFVQNNSWCEALFHFFTSVAA